MPKFATGINVRFGTISGRFFTNYLNIFQKTEVQTIILMCWIGLKPKNCIEKIIFSGFGCPEWKFVEKPCHRKSLLVIPTSKMSRVWFWYQRRKFDGKSFHWKSSICISEMPWMWFWFQRRKFMQGQPAKKN